MANVTPISSTQPAPSETRIEVTMPRGPAVAASRVSSVMWAEASYPVNVYWASSRTSVSTENVEPQPVLLTKCPNTYEADWWWLGTKTSTATMSRTPMMCHQTLTSFSLATTLTPNWFSSACTARIA